MTYIEVFEDVEDVVQVSDIEILLCAAQSSCVGKVWKTSGALSCCNLHVVPPWSRGHTCDPLLLLLCQIMYVFSWTIFYACCDLFSA